MDLFKENYPALIDLHNFLYGQFCASRDRFTQEFSYAMLAILMEEAKRNHATSKLPMWMTPHGTPSWMTSVPTVLEESLSEPPSWVRNGRCKFNLPTMMKWGSSSKL